MRRIQKAFHRPMSTDGIDMKSIAIEVDASFGLSENKLVFNIW